MPAYFSEIDSWIKAQDWTKTFEQNEALDWTKIYERIKAKLIDWLACVTLNFYYINLFFIMSLMFSLFSLEVIEKSDFSGFDIFDIFRIGYFTGIWLGVSNMQEFLYVHIFIGIFIIFVVFVLTYVYLVHK